MSKKMKSLSAIAVAVTATASLAACGGGSSSGGGSGSAAAGSKGGTLYYLTKRPVEHLDPQRVYIGRDISNLGRTVYRSLVVFPVTEDTKQSHTPVPDLATDTGKSSNNAKTWSFTLRDGVKWQDGKAITCEDLKYGISRTFAQDVITGGPNYAISYLNIPSDAKGSPIYKGPYTANAAGDAAFNKAVTCSGNTITYNFKQAFPDFPLAIASLRAFDPYRKDKDQGAKSNFMIFSNGPYMLQGTYAAGKGYTLVRNPNYDPKSDPSGTRKALPDKIIEQEGLSDEVISNRMIANSGNDQYAVTDRSIKPPFYSQIVGDVAKRAVNPTSPFIDYLLPNFNRIKNEKVREALMVSTNTAGWIEAGGGPKAFDPAYSMVAPDVVGYKKNPIFGALNPSGDIEKAKQLLKEAGVPTPVKLKFSYSTNGPTADKQAGVLKDTWAKAGFDVSLNPLADTYYDVIQKPNSDSDIMWAGWGADWPTATAVLPPLFDSRVNLTAGSNGQDYGNYKSDAVNKLIDEAANSSSVDAATGIYQQMDEQLAKDVAYIPLENSKFYFVRGSKVTGYINNPAVSMYPDLGSIGVQQ